MGQANPFRYKGYFYDSETMMYYLLTRYYVPEWGRFLSAADAVALNPQSISELNFFIYCVDNPIMLKQDPGLGNSTTIPSILMNGIYKGGNGTPGEYPSVPEWLQLTVGSIPDIILGYKYLLSTGTHSMFAYSTNYQYRQPILGKTFRFITISGSPVSDFANLSLGVFKQILTGDSKAGFWTIAKSVGGTIGLIALVNFIFNLYENDWKIDKEMLIDTAIDTAIGVTSYFLAAGTMALITAGAVMAGFAMPGILVVGGVILLSVGFEWAIREITGYHE